MKPEKTENAKPSFDDLLTRFADLANTDRTSPEYVTALTDLATAVAYSVLKKCIDTSGNQTLTAVRADLSRDRRNLENLHYASANAYTMQCNADGDPVRAVNDKSAVVALDALSKEAMGDGVDLVNDAVVAILTELDRMDKNGDPVNLTAPYSVRRLNKKVWIKTADSVGGWETVETTPIQEIYKSVRRAIMSSRAMQTDPRNGYSYLSDLATDPETGETADIYRRLPKYCDLGGQVTDFNGACTVYTTDRASVDRYDEIVGQLKLSRKQATVLALRMAGYGNKSIATYMGVTENSVKGAMSGIREKASAIGLDPEHIGETIRRSHEKDKNN